MQQGHGAEPRRRRAARFTPGDDDYGREAQRSRLVEERERAAIELFVGTAAHELMEPLITAEMLARSIEEQLEDRADAATRSDL